MFCPRAGGEVPDCPKDGTAPGVIFVGYMVVAAAPNSSGHSETFDVYGPSNLQI